ncbi:NAD-dependent epimerase/dehydratase family protein [Streptomyces tsukubensis]
MPTNILVTGANGFIGRHVVHAALTKPAARVRLNQRSPRTAAPYSGSAAETVHADLTDPASLTGLCRDTDTVIHCASLVGGDHDSLRAVNDLGTRALVDEAQRQGVRRIVYISTAAVYGRGPFRGAGPAGLPQAPASAASRTRAAAERHVLAAGGTVLRPHLVYGTGDRWVLPGLAQLLRHLGAGIACPTLHSAIDVGALAGLAVAAALHEDPLPAVLHANHPRPISTSALVRLVQGHLGLPRRAPLSLRRATELAHNSPRALHHLAMLGTDHWFDSDPVWRALGCSPGPAPADGLTRHTGWYGPLLRTAPPRPHRSRNPAADAGRHSAGACLRP